MHCHSFSKELSIWIVPVKYLNVFFPKWSEQQYFNLEKKLAESQEQFLSQSKEYHSIKEENGRLGKSCVLFCF